jgi:hypothetical protein
MAAFALKAHFPRSIELEDARSVVDGALRRETELAKARCAYFERACKTFEQQLGMTSDEFMRQFEAGDLGDDAIYFDWYAVKCGLDLWDHKLLILSGVTV